MRCYPPKTNNLNKQDKKLATVSLSDRDTKVEPFLDSANARVSITQEKKPVIPDIKKSDNKLQNVVISKETESKISNVDLTEVSHQPNGNMKEIIEKAVAKVDSTNDPFILPRIDY